MKKINIDKQDLIFFVKLGCSNTELADVFSCSERLIANRKKEWGLLSLTSNNLTTQIINSKRKCINCGNKKQLNEFNKQASAKSGYRSKCKNCQAIESKQYYERNKSKINAKSKKHYELNKRAYLEKYARRRAAKIQAVPKWYSELDSFIFEEMRDLCKLRYNLTNVIHEIDHIVPLQSNIVCGLHWHKNWQILTRAENRSKSNKLLEKYL